MPSTGWGRAAGFEAVVMHALFFRRSDDALHRPVLLRVVRGDEHLIQPVTVYQASVVRAS
ncbi:hypothetical protein [Alcanivorax quisquiliarum]|uniref:Uncharacterized protein n=1 Tax=Alcanivorax quisquiliarum TaxID=2933565 RepID=A0ABT0E9L1_9GAMM|nr:hypothetical protein [Alcanivorax quisquiliarum]MCK0538334.1 hypothetical protein [Alcanivorax quisquiliarum]